MGLMRARTELMSLSRSTLQRRFKASLTSVNLSSDWTSSEGKYLNECKLVECTDPEYLQRHPCALPVRLQLVTSQK
jgi:hypothetical protein